MYQIEQVRQVKKYSEEGTELTVSHKYCLSKEFLGSKWSERQLTIFFPRFIDLKAKDVVGLFCVYNGTVFSLGANIVVQNKEKSTPFFLEGNNKFNLRHFLDNEYLIEKSETKSRDEILKAHVLRLKNAKLNRELENLSYWIELPQFNSGYMHHGTLDSQDNVTDREEVGDLMAKINRLCNSLNPKFTFDVQGNLCLIPLHPFDQTIPKSLWVNGTAGDMTFSYFAKVAVSDKVWEKASEEIDRANKEYKKMMAEIRFTKAMSEAAYFERVGKYEFAAEIYEENGLLEKAKRMRDMLRGSETVRVDLNQLIRQLSEKGFTLTYHCSNCGAPVKVDAKTNADSLKFCSHCGSQIQTIDISNFVKKYLS